MVSVRPICHFSNPRFAGHLPSFPRSSLHVPMLQSALLLLALTLACVAAVDVPSVNLLNAAQPGGRPSPFHSHTPTLPHSRTPTSGHPLLLPSCFLATACLRIVRRRCPFLLRASLDPLWAYKTPSSVTPPAGVCSLSFVSLCRPDHARHWPGDFWLWRSRWH